MSVSEANLERLSSALDAYNRADVGYADTPESAKALIRAQNILIDRCVGCGMPADGNEFAFAAETVTHWLTTAGEAI